MDAKIRAKELRSNLSFSIRGLFDAAASANLTTKDIGEALAPVVSEPGTGVAPAVRMLLKPFVTGEQAESGFTKNELFSAVMDGLDAEMRDDSEESWEKFNAGVQSVIEQFKKVTEKIKEDNLRPSVDAESDDAPLGRYAFANSRITSASVPYEDDTYVETNLLNALIDHFFESRPIPEDKAQMLRDFLRKGMYSDIIKPPDAELLYRGVKSTVEFVESATGKKGLDLVEQMRSEGKVYLEFDASKIKPWRPKGGSSFSWTTSLSVAKDFTYGPGTQLMWPVVAVARSDENVGTFLSGKDGLYKIASIQRTFSGEHEAVAIGPVKLSKILVYRPSDSLIDDMDNKMTEKEWVDNAVSRLYTAEAMLRESQGDPMYCVRGGEVVLVRRKTEPSSSWREHRLKRVTYFRPEELVRMPNRAQFGRNWTFERDSWLVSVRDEQFLYIPDATV